MGSLSSWTEAANKAAETYKAPASASLSGSLSIGNLNAAKQSEIPQPYKAPGGDLFDTSTASTFSPQSLNVGRFYDHPGYKKLQFSAYRDNDAYYNKHTSGIGDFTRAMKNFGPGFWGGFASNYNGLASILEGDAISPSRLDFTKGRKAEEAASRAMSTRGGFSQSAANIPYNFNYTLGIAASIAAEDLAMIALAPETAGGSLVYGAYRTVKGAGKVVKSIYNVARGARTIDKVADAKKLYSLVRSGVTGTGRLLIPETATQFGKFYRAAGAAGNASRVGSATLNMFKTANGFGSMYRDLRMISLAVDESSVEAAGVRSSLMDQLTTEFTSKYGRIPTAKEYGEMRAIADKGLAADYWSNLPVIYLTNKLTFGNASLAPRFLKNFAAPIKTQGGRLLYTATGGKVASEIVERTLNPVKYIKRAVTNRKLAKANLYATAKYFKANLGEGVQELYQTGVATTFEDYYKNLYDDPRMTGFKHYKESARKGVGSLVSQEGLEAFLGGVLGGGAINMGGKIARLGKEYVMKTTSPNQYEALKKNQLDELKAVNDLINEEGSNVLKFLSPDITNLVELIKDNGTAYEFAEADNFKGIEDIRATSLYKKIQQLESAGATDTFIDALEQMKMMEADEKMDALGVDTVEKADKLIDVISERTKVIRSNIDYVNKNYENPYNPNDYEVGTQERNEEILKQFAWEQAKKDLAFNFNQFTVTAERLGEIYNSAVRDGAVSDMSNKDFSVLFNTSLAESKKSGAVFESSLENEIGFLNSEKANVSAELSNITEQSKTASGEDKQQLNLRKAQLQDKIKKLTKRETALVKYAAAAEKVKASRATVKEGVERPSEEEALKDLKSAFEAYMIQIGEENNTPVNKLKLDETFSKLLDFIDVAEDNRLASNAITILSDPAAVKRLSDIHFDGIKKRFEAHVGLSKMLAFGFVESKRVNEYIEALEEIGVVVPVKEMQALILEGTLPTQYISIAKIDVDANGFVIEGTPLWDQIQEISDQYEMGRAETEADIESEYEEKTSTYSEKDAVKEFENTGQVSDVTIEAIALKIKNSNDLTLGEQAIYTEKSKEVEAKLKQLQKADESKEEPAVEEGAEETSNPRSFDEQAAASQQASKETVGEEKKTKRTAPVKAKYQAAALRKELSGTKVLEKLEADFKAENTRLRKEGKSQQTFVEFINGLENIDELVSEGRDQANEVARSKSAAKKVKDFERQLKRARTVEEVGIIEFNAQTLPFIKSSDISKLDFEKRKNEIMAAEAKEKGMQNVPEPTPAQQAPEGDNLDQATQTVENADSSELFDENTKTPLEKGGSTDVNDILC